MIPSLPTVHLLRAPNRKFIDYIGSTETADLREQEIFSNPARSLPGLAHASNFPIGYNFSICLRMRVSRA
jgi:hypothetical protein